MIKAIGRQAKDSDLIPGPVNRVLCSLILIFPTTSPMIIQTNQDGAMIEKEGH